MQRRSRKNDSEPSSYWLSVGDLMASILAVFILIFVYQVLNINEKLESKEKIINEISSVKNRIIEKLNGEFEKEDLKILIDQTTGSIKLDEKILFDYGKDYLKPEGKQYLNKFIPLYTKLLLSDDDIKNEISRIIIEGHTDNVGSYLYNLDLSQRRAYQVVKHIYQDMPYFEQKEILKEYITANGRSSMKLIRNEQGEVDHEKSRRVEFQFKLKDDEALNKVKILIEEGI